MPARTISDAQMRAAMDACKGNLSLAAKMVGMSRSGIETRVKNNPALRELREQLVVEHGSANAGRGFAKKDRQAATLEQIEQALKGSSGGVALAAKALNISYQSLHERINSGPESKELKAVLSEIRQVVLGEALIAWTALIRGEKLPGGRSPNWQAVDKALRIYGGLVDRHEVSGVNGGPLAYQEVDAAKKRAAAELRIWRDGQEATAA